MTAPDAESPPNPLADPPPTRLLFASALRQFSVALLRAVFALILAGCFAVATIRYAHGDIRQALNALWSGAFGSTYAFGNTLVEMIPLLLTGLGVAVAFRARMFNIGGEGQLLVGALSASYVALNLPLTRHLGAPVLLTTMVIAGAFAGGVWALIAAWLKVARGVPEVISTIMLNFVATELLSYLVNGPMQRPDHSQPATDVLPDPATLPIIWTGTPLHAGIIIALVAAVVIWLVLNRTVLGFSIDVVGANPLAARLSGYSIDRTLLSSMAISGALCCIAGAVELSGVVGFIPEGYSPGYGFAAVAVALLGRLNVVGIVFSALLFGALSAGSENMERSAGIGHEIGFVIQAVVLLALLASQWDGWGKFVRRRN